MALKFYVLVEQVKSSPEIREKILAAARADRKSSMYPAELNQDIYIKEQGLLVEDFRQLHGLIKDDRIVANGVTMCETNVEESKQLWMDTQSHSSSASSDSHENDYWLGYPTSFYTQFKVFRS